MSHLACVERDKPKRPTQKLEIKIMKNDKITRKFQVSYQLGGQGSEHTKLSAAINALNKASKAAARSGDSQGLSIKVNEYQDGKYYGDGELTQDEEMEVFAAQQ